MTADSARYGGYQEPTCFATGEISRGTVLDASTNIRIQITVINVGLLAFDSGSFMTLFSLFNCCLCPGMVQDGHVINHSKYPQSVVSRDSYDDGIICQ